MKRLLIKVWAKLRKSNKRIDYTPWGEQLWEA